MKSAMTIGMYGSTLSPPLPRIWSMYSNLSEYVVETKTASLITL